MRKRLALILILSLLFILVGSVGAASKSEQLLNSQAVHSQQITNSPYVPSGYTLVFNDEFNSQAIDQTKWYPEFLPHWSNASRISYASALTPGKSEFENISGSNYRLNLKTNNIVGVNDQWSSFDNHVSTGIMSGQYSGPAGSKIGLHEFGNCRSNSSCVVWPGRADQNFKGFVAQYGYYEIKANFCSNEYSSYCIWWMIGFEDDEKRAGEIDIVEMLNNKEYRQDLRAAWPQSTWPDNNCIFFGTHKYEDPYLTEQGHFFGGPNCAGYADTEKTYGLLWTEDEVSLYIDGVLQKTHNNPPKYKMLTILHASVDHYSNNLNVATQNELGIDYFRVYKPSAPALVRNRMWAAQQGAIFNDASYPNHMQWASGDFNGDGRDDLIKWWQNGPWSNPFSVDVHVSTGTKFDAQRWYTHGGQIGEYNSNARWFVGNFNNDDREDLAVVYPKNGSINTQLSIDVYKSNGIGFNRNTYSMPGYMLNTMEWEAGDINGDGLTDLFTHWQGGPWNNPFGIEAFISTGNGFTESRWYTHGGQIAGYNANARWFLDEFTGDNKADLTVVWQDNGKCAVDIFSSQGNDFSRVAGSSRPGTCTNDMKWFSGTFNVNDIGQPDDRADLAAVWSDAPTSSWGYMWSDVFEANP